MKELKQIIYGAKVVKVDFDKAYSLFEDMINEMAYGTKVGDRLNSIEGEDLKQILSVVMYKVWREYDIDKGVHFSTLLKASMKNEIVNLRKEVSRLKRDGNNDVCYYDEKVGDDSEDITMLDTLASPYNLEDEVIGASGLMEKLCRDEKDKESIRLLILSNKMKMGDLAKVEGITRQGLYKKLKKAREVFGKRAKEYGYNVF